MLRARILLAVAFATAFLCANDTTLAFPLQEVMEQTQGSVAHLGIRDSRGTERSSRSGFIVSSDGKLATNFHVVEDAEHVVAVFAGKKEVHIAGVRAFDKTNDVALLQLAPGSYEPVRRQVRTFRFVKAVE